MRYVLRASHRPGPTVVRPFRCRAMTGAVRVSFTVVQARDVHHVNGLYGHLDRARDLKRVAQVLGEASARSREYQSAIDVVNVVLGNTIAAANLLLAYQSWRQMRPKAPPLVVTVDDVTVTVPDASPESLALLERIIRDALTVAAGDDADHDDGPVGDGDGDDGKA